MSFIYSPKFLQMPATQELRDGDTWLITAPYCHIRPDGSRIYIPPSGLDSLELMHQSPFWTTDYGSIPIVLQSVIRKDGVNAPAFILHDWLFECQLFSFEETNDILRDACLTESQVIHAGVTLGGRPVWDRHTDAEIALAQAYGKSFESQLADRWPELLP